MDKCREWRENRPAQRNEPLHPTMLPKRPWQKLGAHILRIEKRLSSVVDYYSRWLEIVSLHRKTEETVIGEFRDIFKTHGIPDVVVSDHQPFLCRQFQVFAQKLSFTQQASSPAFTQANGQVE
ncbi:integrase core domain [Plakobranchus ocellatus]|uniref:Integrase core domain n=1 Tax=Plakobranchus ocellatus TaxID=259542 RepID=A0AAV3Z5X8_9GAST|nr:integrase core domain [Plakobranchus ocellatus]